MIYGKAAVFLGHKASLLSNWMDDTRDFIVSSKHKYQHILNSTGMI